MSIVKHVCAEHKKHRRIVLNEEGSDYIFQSRQKKNMKRYLESRAMHGVNECVN